MAKKVHKGKKPKQLKKTVFQKELEKFPPETIKAKKKKPWKAS